MDRLPNDWVISTSPGRDFAEAYLASKTPLRIATDEVLVESPAFGFVMASLDERAREKNYESYWNGSERALRGDWTARVEALADTAKVFVRAGAGTADWEALSAANTDVVRRALFARYGGDPERFLAACEVMQRFFDRSFVAFCEALGTAADRQLQQSERMFRMMPVGQAVLGGEEVLRKANDAFLQLCGIARAQMHGQTLESLFGPSARDRFATVYATAEASARLAYDHDLRRPDGSTVPVRLEAVCLTAEAAGPVWGVALHDLTERRILESLSIRSAQLEAENHRVSEANEAKNLFLANMSHELRTPMNAILGFSQLLVAGEVGPLSEMQADFVSDIESSGRHLLRLINDILDLSKVEAGKLELYPEEVDLRALTEDSIQLAVSLLAAGSVRVDTDIAESVGPARLDPSRYKQVLLNYLTNAIKFSPPGGRIHVALEPEGPSSFRVSVRDEGPGIAPEDLPRLFGVFEQLDAGRAKRHGGTGLGLALTKKLVESQGGKVGVHCEKGHGCVFHAILPLRAREGTELPSSRQLEGSTHDAPRVLVVEDDRQDQTTIVAALSAAGFAVDTAATGAHARAAIAAARYDAITLDILLPDTDGVALIAELRRLPGVVDVPVIVLSVVPPQEYFRPVGSEVLEKPIDVERLVAAVRAAVARTAARRQTAGR